MTVATFVATVSLVRFEWDENKNIANRKKHGFDFSDAASTFDRPMLQNLDKRREYREDRWVGMGWLGDVVVVIAYVWRDADTIRIISMRKANHRERKKFQAALGD